MNRIKLAAAATAGALAFSVTGMVGTARADTAEDLQTVIDNVPAAAQTLIDTLQIALDTYTSTHSVEATFQDVVVAVAATAGTLGSGTEQFGSLGLGVLLAGAQLATALEPYLEAIDDPSLVSGLVNPDDLVTLVGNLPGAIDALQPFAISAVASALVGNLTAGTGFNAGLGSPAVVGDALNGLNTFLVHLLDNTNFEDLRLGIMPGLGVVAIATAGTAQQIEDAVAPVFEALAPVTGPIVVALTGI